jgi:hypothetical protein
MGQPRAIQAVQRADITYYLDKLHERIVAAGNVTERDGDLPGHERETRDRRQRAGAVPPSGPARLGGHYHRWTGAVMKR